MFDVGRLCVKIAGREAGQKCVIVEVIDDNFVMVDGNLRRKRCNIIHLEPLKETIEISKSSSREDVKEAFKKAGILVEPKRAKRTEKAPKKEGTATEKPVKEKKTAKKKEPKPKTQNA